MSLSAEEGPFQYRPEVVAALWRHGVHPTSHTAPELVRGYVRDVYKYEIRQLRDRMVRREFTKPEYAGRVDALRRKYPVLALMPRDFLLLSDPSSGQDRPAASSQ